MVWYSHLFQNFPQFIVIHTVKDFGIVNKAAIDVFLELSCFFHDPADVCNLISGSSAFSKTSLNIRKFILFSIVVILIYIPTNSARGFPFLHTLSSIYLFITTDYQFIKKFDLSISSGDFHLNSWLNTDRSDLLDNLTGTVQVSESLLDPHGELIPSLRTFTTRSFPRSYSQSLQQEKMETKRL